MRIWRTVAGNSATWQRYKPSCPILFNEATGKSVTVYTSVWFSVRQQLLEDLVQRLVCGIHTTWLTNGFPYSCAVV